jgi:hypothetical protein
LKTLKVAVVYVKLKHALSLQIYGRLLLE